jgi:hypothetical protein
MRLEDLDKYMKILAGLIILWVVGLMLLFPGQSYERFRIYNVIGFAAIGASLLVAGLANRKAVERSN